jgi:hypothetical protein
VGTAGIGKSAARLLYIAMWLENEITIPFDAVIFNLSEKFHSIDQTGTVTAIDPSLHDTSGTLMLLDPCTFLNNAQSVDCKMLVVFSSPSCLVGQANKPNLTSLDKTSKIYVMDAPTLEELRKIHGEIDESE